jgi:hypothetical protein
VRADDLLGRRGVSLIERPVSGTRNVTVSAK